MTDPSYSAGLGFHAATEDSDEDTVSSDDQVEKFGRKLPQRRYKTVDNYDDSDDDSANIDPSSQRSRKRERATYGVFWEGVDSSDDDHSLNPKRSKKGKGRDSTTANPVVAPVFVKGQTQTATEEEEEEEENKEAEQEGDPAKDVPIEEEQVQTPEEIAAEAEYKRQQEQANEHFLALLQKGRGKQRQRAPAQQDERNAASNIESSASSTFDTASLPVPEEPTVSAVASTASGLGFSVASQQRGSNSFASSPGLGMGSLSGGAGLGMGMGGGTVGSSVPMQFGRASSYHSSTKKPAPAKKTDPNMGNWEKHTKGIGMKLLTKMGYKGSGGLTGGGAKRKRVPTTDQSTHESDATVAPGKTGISQPVAVKVRPANLGLGFGNFKEATSLKSNRQIEAEVRGLPVEKERKQFPTTTSVGAASSSALPSVTDVMQQQSWKRQRPAAGTSKPKKSGRTFVPYSELLQKQKEEGSRQPTKIIDMRGPSVDIETGQVPLAEEALHNVSLLLSTYETKMHSASHFAGTHQRQKESLQADLASMQEQQKNAQERQSKLEHILQILDDIESILSSQLDFANCMVQVQERIQQLGEAFSPEEREKLQFSDTVVPTLLGTVIETEVEKWNPVKADITSSEQLMRSVLLLNNNNGLAGADISDVRKSLLTQYLLPRMKRKFESSRWDPVRDHQEAGLKAYELLDRLLKHAEVPSVLETDDDEERVLPSEEERKRTAMSDLVRRELVHNVVHSKLSRAVQAWKPRFDSESGTLKDRLDLWILPWLPHMTEDKSIIPTLVADCKRKLKTALSLLQKSVTDDESFLDSCIQTLGPWKGILKKESLQGMVASSVTPRLARSLAKCSIAVGKAQQKWNSVAAVFQLHGLGLLSDLEFVSVLEGELLPHWAESMHQWIVSSQGCNVATLAATTYSAWKLRIFGVGSSQNTQEDEDATRSHEASQRVLRSDANICRCFYAVLLMIQAVAVGDEVKGESRLDDLRVVANTTNYRIVLARRKSEAKRNAADDLLRMEETASNGVEARVRLNHISGRTPTFREVVEEYARERDILFQPRMGSKALKDGKQVFLFGKVPLYLDTNVAYALLDGSGEWKAMPLDAIAEKATGRIG